MAIYIIMYTHVSKSNDCLKERGMIMHTHIIVEIMVVAFLNRLNQIFISGMPYPSLSYQRLKLLWMQDILFSSDIYGDHS